MHETALPHIPYVVQSCEIPVSNSSSQRQYYVFVRTKTEEKQFEAYKTSELLCCFVLLLVVSWRGLCGQVGLRTVVLRKSVWEEEESRTDEERNGRCVRSKIWERLLVGVEFLSGTCHSAECGSGGNCCVEIRVVTQSNCHPADSSVVVLCERQR